MAGRMTSTAIHWFVASGAPSLTSRMKDEGAESRETEGIFKWQTSKESCVRCSWDRGMPSVQGGILCIAQPAKLKNQRMIVGHHSITLTWSPSIFCILFFCPAFAMSIISCTHHKFSTYTPHCSGKKWLCTHSFTLGGACIITVMDGHYTSLHMNLNCSVRAWQELIYPHLAPELYTCYVAYVFSVQTKRYVPTARYYCKTAILQIGRIWGTFE